MSGLQPMVPEGTECKQTRHLFNDTYITNMGYVPDQPYGTCTRLHLIVKDLVKIILLKIKN